VHKKLDTADMCI